MTTQVMVELQVMFTDPTIENYTLLTEHEMVDVDPITREPIGQDLATTAGELRQEAERVLGELEDAQCFYRIFKREVDE